MRSSFAAGEMLGTKMVARTPRFIAAYATAAPWFPPDAATTPAAGTSRASRFANAPRVLNEPACCSSSSLASKRNAAEADVGRIEREHRRAAHVRAAMRSRVAMTSRRSIVGTLTALRQAQDDKGLPLRRPSFVRRVGKQANQNHDL